MLRAALLGASLAVLTACGGDPTPPQDNTPARIDVTPATPITLASGSTATLHAEAFTKDNRSLGSTGIGWSSLDQTIAGVSGGVITGARAGSTSVHATLGSLTSANVSVNVTPGAPSQLAVRTQPAGAASGIPLVTPPVIELRDAAGNLTTASDVVVTATLSAGGGSITGATATSVNGVATFSGLTVSGLIGAKTVTFTAPSLVSVASSAFTLSAGTPAALAIRQQPAAGTAYAPLTTPAIVEIQDAAGNLTNSTATVTASIATGGGTLAGATSVAAVGGAATFSTLAINGNAGARSLLFSSGSLASATSGSFAVAAAPPAIIILSSSTVNPTALLGSTPSPIDVAITNHGVFPLTNLRVTNVTYSQTVTPWLAVTFPSGVDAPATMHLVITPGTLPLGTYTASVALAGDGAPAPAFCVVNFTIAPVFTNAYGTSANKVSFVSVGATLDPGTVTTSGTGTPATTDPSLTYASRSASVASVNAAGVITAIAPGQSWIVARSTQYNSDSVLVIVPRTSGVIVRTDLTTYQYRVGDTISVHVRLDTRGATIGAATVTFSWAVWTGAQGMANGLAFVDVTPSGPLAPVTAFDGTLNVLRITGAAASGATGVIDLATVRVRVTAPTINVMYANAVDLVAVDFTDLLSAATQTSYPLIGVP